MNGVNYDKLSHGAGEAVKTLEFFFFGCPRIVGLQHFPALRCLRIVNQKLPSLLGIGSCPFLEELWVCEGLIKVRKMV